jgi:hypothetical protein
VKSCETHFVNWSIEENGSRRFGHNAGYNLIPVAIVHSGIDLGDDCRIDALGHILDCGRPMGTVGGGESAAFIEIGA